MIDSHAHLSWHKFDGSFHYLVYDSESFSVKDGDRGTVLEDMKNAGICGYIEPAIDWESNHRLLQYCKALPHAYPALGVHPTRTWQTKFSNMRRLKQLVAQNNEQIVAIGETGLDFHKAEKHKLKQYLWFIYQLHLAHKFRKPLILHIRNADKQAYRVLRLSRRFLHGGIVHCFTGNEETAKKYAALGLKIGIGGALLGAHTDCAALRETVRSMPLASFVLETDAPYVLPEFESVGISKKSKRNIRNTPLTLFAVAQEIAALKDCSAQEVEASSDHELISLFGKIRDSKCENEFSCISCSSAV